MSEVFCKFNDILSDNQIAELYRRCNYDKDDKELYFTSNDFIDGYSLIEYGDNDYEFGEQFTNIINKNGDFVEFKLNKDIQYANGKIIKLNDSDNGTYFFKVHRILELDYKYEPLKGYVVKKQRETSFFYIKVTRYPIKADENAVDLNFVINPELKVIASFSDDNAWGIKYDGYNNCNVYTERNFFFINEERKFLVFTQKLIANSDETGFFDEHMYGLEPELYDAFMRENDPNWGYEYGLSESIYEEELDEETLDKAIKKYEGIIDENEEEDDDDIPYLGDINFFFEDKNNKLYKDAFSDYYRTLYGIIDCYTKSSQQLTPFTDCLDYVINIIWARWRCEKEIKEHGHYNFYGQGWDFGHTRFWGYVMDNKFFDYPSIVKGFTLKYVLKYYPSILRWLVEHNIIIIPNKLLNNLGNNELTRYIRLKQEVCLEYSSISSIDDTIRSNEKYGIISTYQDKTLRQIIYSKGGTKHLVNLIKHSNLEIEKDVIEQLINESNNQLETKCYNIILDVIEDIEYQEEEYNAWVQQQMHDDYVRECNEEFNNMMNDFDAWGNID